MDESMLINKILSNTDELINSHAKIGDIIIITEKRNLSDLRNI